MKEATTISIEKISGEVPALDKVVQRLNVSAANAKPEVIDHIIVQYDRRKAVAEKLAGNRFSFAGLFGLRKPVEYYRIDTYQHATVSFSQVYKVTHPEYGEIELTMKYVVSAKEGAETDLIEELMRRETPATVLGDRIKEWVVKGITNYKESLFNDYGYFAEGFDRFVAGQFSGVGLQAEVTTKQKTELPITETIRSSAKEIAVQPKGYNDYLKLEFDAVLVPDRKSQTESFINLGYKNRDEFEKFLVNRMQEYIREAVTYNDITSYLHAKVRTGLMDYWNIQLRKERKGWIVAELVLYSDDVPPASFKFERMEIEVVLRNAKIPLINTVLLNLENAERFKNSRIENLETWIKDKLQQTAHNVLSKVSYAELVSGIEALGSVIKSNLDKQALLIGYRVEYLLTSELVDKARLNFHFQFSEEEQVFQTTLSEKIKLDINIAGRIISLNHDTWRSTLTPDTDFVEEMKKEVLRYVRQMLLRNSADDFYTRFTELVEPKLISGIKDILLKDFNVDPSVDISPQMGVSVLRQLIIDLQSGHQEVKISCFGEGAIFRVTFSVMAVDPLKWSLFAIRNHNISSSEIKKVIGDRIRIFVENAVRRHVSDVNILRDARIPGLIEKFARESDPVIREKLGLIIDIFDVEQVSNKLGDLVAGENLISAEAKIRKLLGAIRKVDNEILDGLERGDEDWEIQDLEERKAKLQNRLDNERFESNRLSLQSGQKDFEQLMEGNTDIRKLDHANDDKENLDAGKKDDQ